MSLAATERLPFPADGEEGLTLLYSCKACGLNEATVTVRFRDKEEPVTEWMERVVQVMLYADHHFRSPTCESEVCDLKIPITGAQWIGGRSLQ